MVVIGKKTIDEIVKILVTEFTTERQRRGWLDLVFVENSHVALSIDCSGDPLNSTYHIVTSLLNNSENANNNLLWFFLETIAPNLGGEKERKILELKPLIINATELPTTTFDLRNPYKGFKAFQRQDSRDFFGRTQLVSELLDDLGDKLQRNLPRFVSLIGASGSGKSSAVMAGLLPALSTGMLHSSDTWTILPTMRPGEHPIENLAAVIHGGLSSASIKEITSDLSDRRGLHIFGQTLGSENKLVLFIDQFEELFTVTSTEEERAHFIDLITTAASENGGNVIILSAMRADFYDRPMNYPGLGDLIKHHIPMFPMSVDELYDAVRKPAQLVGLKFDEDLVAELIFEVRDEPGSLPLLQFTLDKLYQQRENMTLTIDTYNSLGGNVGGIKGVLVKQADSIYNSLNSSQRAIFQRVLLKLVEVRDETVTKKQVERSDLELAEVSSDQITNVLSTLSSSENRLIVASGSIHTSDHGTETYYEFSHEAILSHWERLANWIADKREDLRFGSQLLSDAKAWENTDKSDDSYLVRGTKLAQAIEWQENSDPNSLQKEFISKSIIADQKRQRELQEQRDRQLRQARFIAGSFAIFLVIAIALTIFAFDRQNQASKSAEKAAANAATSDANLLRSLEIRAQNLASLANQELSNGNPAAALSLALQAGENYPEIYSEQAHYALLSALSSPVQQRLHLVHENTVNGATWNNESIEILSWSQDGTARVWDSNSGDLKFSLVHDTSVWGAEWSPDYEMIATRLPNGEVHIWNAKTGEHIFEFRHGSNNAVRWMEWHQDSAKILTTTSNGNVYVWSTDSGQNLGILEPESSDTLKFIIAFWNPLDNRILIWQEPDESSFNFIYTRIWNYDANESIVISIGDPNRVLWKSDGTDVLSLDISGNIRIWNSLNGSLINEFRIHDTSAFGARWITDEQILSWSQDSKAIVWDVNTGEIIREFVHGTMSRPIVDHAIYDNEGERLLTWTSGQNIGSTAQIWLNARIPFDDDPDSRLIMHHSTDVRDAQWSSDGRFISTLSQDNIIRLWNSTTGIEEFSLYHDASIGGQIWHESNNELLTWSENAIYLWSFERPNSIPSEHNILYPAVSPNGRFVFYWNDENEYEIWDFEEFDQIYVSEPFSQSVDIEENFIEWSNSGEELLVSIVGASSIGNWSRSIPRIWSANQMRMIPIDNLDFIELASWSPSDDYLAYFTDMKKFTVIDTLSLEVVFEMSYDQIVTQISWNESETQLFINLNKTIHVIDIERKEETNLLDGQTGTYSHFQISPNNMLIATWNAQESSLEIRDLSGNLIQDYRILTFGELEDFRPLDIEIMWHISSEKIFLWESRYQTDDIVAIDINNLTVRTLHHSGNVIYFEWNPDFQSFLTLARDNTITIWDSNTFEQLEVFSHSVSVSNYFENGATFINEGRQVLSWSDDRTIRVWDLSTGITNYVVESVDGIFEVELLSDQQLLMVGTNASQFGTSPSNYEFWNLNYDDLLEIGTLYEQELRIPNVERSALGISTIHPSPTNTVTPAATESSRLEDIDEFDSVYSIDQLILDHDEDNFIEIQYAGLQVRDFRLIATFNNPYNTEIGDWSHGVFFRDNSSSQYRLSFTSQRQWKLSLFESVTGAFTTTQQGSFEQDRINLELEGLNTIRLDVLDDQAIFYLNDQRISLLDLSDHSQDGLIGIATGLERDTEYEGFQTIVTDYQIFVPSGLFEPTPTPTPTVTESPNLTLVNEFSEIYYVEQLVLEHDGETGVEIDSTNFEVSNFRLEGTFSNPYSTDVGNWSHGIFFRDNDTAEYRLIFNSSREWRLTLYEKGTNTFTTVERGSFAESLITIDPSQENTLRLDVYNGQGIFFLNDQRITILDLTQHTSSGSIGVATGLERDSEYEEYETIITDYRILVVAGAVEPTSTPSPTHTQSPNLVDVDNFIQIYSVDQVILEHDDDGAVEINSTDFEVANFRVEATFTNPYSDQVGDWSHGIFFRNNNNAEYRLRYSGSQWQLTLYENEDDLFTTIASGVFGRNVINIDDNQENTLRLDVYDDQGILYLNDQQISLLDLTRHSESGTIGVATGIQRNTEIIGYQTIVNDYRIFVESGSVEPTAVPTATATPERARIATLGLNEGLIPIGGGQTWTFSVEEAQTVNIRVEALNPAGTFTSTEERIENNLLDTYLIILDEADTIIAENDDVSSLDEDNPSRTDSAISVELEPNTIYRIEVRSYANESGGDYNLIIESE